MSSNTQPTQRMRRLSLVSVILAGTSGLVTAQAEDLGAIARASVGDWANRPFTESSITSTIAMQLQPYVYGVPDDDYELTAFYADAKLSPGEAGGFDVFNAVDPGDDQPGEGLVTSFDAGSMWSGLTLNQKQYVSGRFILGDHNKPYYLGNRTGNVDRDFAYIINMKQPDHSEVILHGSPTDYEFVEVRQGSNKGTAIFYTKGAKADMIGFILDGYGYNKQSDPPFRYTDRFPAPSQQPAYPQGFDQFGGVNANGITAVQLDSQNNIYVGGITREDLPGAQGGEKEGRLFIAKYSPNGQRKWLSMFGSKEYLKPGRTDLDFLFDLKVNEADNAIYTAGRFHYDGPVATEAYVSRHDMTTGKLVDLGVYNGWSVHFAGACAPDDKKDGSVFVSGLWTDGFPPSPFLLRVDKDNLGQRDKLVTNIEPSFLSELWGGMYYNNGKIYSTGWMLSGFPPGRDPWLGCIDAQTMKRDWYAQWGAVQQDWAWDVEADEDGFLYTVGHTYGRVKEGQGTRFYGGNDAYLVKIEPDKGKVVWVAQLGTAAHDSARSVAVVGNHVYICGHTYGDLGGKNQGESDVWVAKYDLDGNELRRAQFGTDHEDRGFIAASNDQVILAGITQGSMVKANGGFMDAFILKLDTNLNLK